jgi:hypothetical protein
MIKLIARALDLVTNFVCSQEPPEFGVFMLKSFNL